MNCQGEDEDSREVVDEHKVFFDNIDDDFLTKIKLTVKVKKKICAEDPCKEVEGCNKLCIQTTFRDQLNCQGEDEDPGEVVEEHKVFGNIDVEGLLT